MTAPRRGYGTPAKEQYRKLLYDWFDWLQGCGGCWTPVEHRRMAVVDTCLALETIHLLRRGYTSDHIWVANSQVVARNHAAFLATFTRSLRQAGFRGANCRVHPGEDLLGMVDRSSYQFDMINLDACAPAFSSSGFAAYLSGLKNRLRLSYSALAVTVMAGRERRGQLAAWSEIVGDFPFFRRQTEYMTAKQKHDLRADAIRLCLNDRHTYTTRHQFRHLYVSGRAPMLALAFHVAGGASTIGMSRSESERAAALIDAAATADASRTVSTEASQ